MGQLITECYRVLKESIRTVQISKTLHTDFIFLLLCTHRPCNVFGGVTRGWIWVFRFVFLVFFLHIDWNPSGIDNGKQLPQKREKEKKSKKKNTPATSSPRFVCDVVFGSWSLNFGGGGGGGGDQCYVFVALAWAGPRHRLEPCETWLSRDLNSGWTKSPSHYQRCVCECKWTKWN